MNFVICFLFFLNDLINDRITTKKNSLMDELSVLNKLSKHLQFP